MKPNFSVVLIARNEEKTLPRLLSSLTDFRNRGGEIVLVDTGSSDRTAEIARAAGCKVEEVGDRFVHVMDEQEHFDIEMSFCKQGDAEITSVGQRNFDYSAARDYAATLASNNMIAMPDCDEAYTMLNIDKVDEMIAAGTEQFEYQFVYAHDGEGVPVIQFRHSKFYDRRKMHWTGIIHEVLTGEAKREYVGEDTIKLEHWQNTETNRSHYLTGLALACHLDPQNDRNSHYFGRELMYTGRFNSAIAELERHVAMNKWPAERAQSLIYMGDCLLTLGQPEAALGAFVRAFDISPDRREPLMRIAEYYYRKGSADHVIAYTAAALQITAGNDFYGNFEPYYQNVPHELMYWALWQKREYKASKVHFDICFAYQPFNPKYLADYHWYYKLPKMNFIVDTNGKEDDQIATETSISSLNYPVENIACIIRDNDDPDVPSIRELVEAGEEGWYVYVPAGFAFEKESVMTALKTAMDNKRLFMAFNTGDKTPDAGGECVSFLVRKDIYQKILSSAETLLSDSTWEAVQKVTPPMWCKRALITKSSSL